ncbi:MAG: DUF4292 domain-containing protein [Paludibacteraceae bacterium]|nr:DUF4292 domain-containing protein [Paludibacteraceae bacterium]
MKTRKYILLVLAALVLAACGTKKALTVKPAQKPAWHTCLIQGARATVTKGSDRVSATVTMQTVRDSMIIISVMPMLGIEMLRLEATPQELIAIDKIHGQYATTDFKQLNHKLTPRLNWTVLQQISSAELPTGAETAHLQYTLGKETIDIVLDYTERKLDVPLRMNRQRTDRYTKIDITKWL